MLMLDEDESFWRDECDEPVVQKPAAGAGQKPAIRREAPPPGREVRGPDADIDKYLGALPGVQDLFSEKDFVNQMLVGVSAASVSETWCFRGCAFCVACMDVGTCLQKCEHVHYRCSFGVIWPVNDAQRLPSIKYVLFSLP